MLTQNEQQQVAKTIFKQMGGTNKLSAMIGANNFAFGTNQDQEIYVTFRFKVSKVANQVRITLNHSDTYTMEFFKIRGTNVKAIEKISMVYCDQLIKFFENTTKLYLSL